MTLSLDIPPFVFDYIDLLWLVVAWLIATRCQFPWAVMFVVLCAVSLRLQDELIRGTGFTTGFTKIFTTDVKDRALIVYAIFSALYFLMIYYSPRSPWFVLMSATLAVYFMAFITSLFIMAI